MMKRMLVVIPNDLCGFSFSLSASEMDYVTNTPHASECVCILYSQYLFGL